MVPSRRRGRCVPVASHSASGVSSIGLAGGTEADCPCGQLAYGNVQGQLRLGAGSVRRWDACMRWMTGAVWGLSGAGADFKRDKPPDVEVRRGRLPGAAPHCGLQPTTCAPNVRSRSRSHVTWARAYGSARFAQSEFLHQYVSGGGEQHAQLTGPVATAARAVDLQAIEQLLDPVLDDAAGHRRSVHRRNAAYWRPLVTTNLRVVARLAFAELGRPRP